MKMNDKYMGRKDYNISKKKIHMCTQETLVLVLTLLLIGCVTLGKSFYLSEHSLLILQNESIRPCNSNIWWFQPLTNLFTFEVKGWRVSTSMHCQWWLLFFLLRALGLSCSIWDLVPWPRIEPRPPALEAWSLNQWTTRDVPASLFWQPPFSHLVAPFTPFSLFPTGGKDLTHGCPVDHALGFSSPNLTYLIFVSSGSSGAPSGKRNTWINDFIVKQWFIA